MGRGAVIGVSTVVRGSIPSVSIVIGIPAKVVVLGFTSEEIIEHEKQLFPKDERINIKIVEKWGQYFSRKGTNVLPAIFPNYHFVYTWRFNLLSSKR